MPTAAVAASLPARARCSAPSLVGVSGAVGARPGAAVALAALLWAWLVASGCAADGARPAADGGDGAAADLGAGTDDAAPGPPDLLAAGCGDGGLECGGACVDPTIDQRHCGRCDHGCLGGACLSGTCGPNIIFQIDHPLAVAADSRFVYFTDDVAGSVSRHRLVAGEGGPFEVLALGEAGPVALAVDGDSAYWANQADGTIRRRALAAGPPVTLADGQAGASAVAVDGAFVYFTAPGAGAVRRAPLAGGPPETLASGLGGPAHLALDATSVYVTCAGDGTVLRIDKAGGKPTTLASGQPQPGGVAVDGTRVCWGLRAAGQVRCVALAGGAAAAVADGQAGPDTLALDGDALYFTNASDTGDGSVVRVALPGGPAVTLLASPFGADPRGLVLDAVSLMFADHASGIIWRLAR